MSNILIYVEHSQDKPKKASLAAITFGQQLAQKSGDTLNLVLVGPGAAKAADAVKGYGAAKILVVEHPALGNYSTDGYLAAVALAAKTLDAKAVAAASSSTSKDILPRLAVRLNAGMASEVTAVIDAKTFKRPMWAGNVIATVELTTATKVFTVRATEFAAPTAGSASVIENVAIELQPESFKCKFVALKAVKSERPELTSANRIIAGGRGTKGADGFKLIEQLADALGAAIGASRAACDAGWVPNDLQVGQTGKIVAPDLYIGVGISGAIQHLAGMKGSKIIVAINKDPEAPIFQVADYGLVADLFKAVPELIEAVKKA